MKKNFTSGLITGLCSAILLFIIVGSLFIMVQSKAEGNAGDSSSKKDSTKQEEIEYDQIVQKLTYLQTLVDNYYLEDISKTDFADGIYKGFIASLDDPYSVYYTADEYSALMESSSGTYCGIGATVSQDAKTGVITIVKPFSTGPAYKAGILPGDILYKVNDEEVTGVDLSKVVSEMKGKEGTTVKITIVREGEADPLDFTVTREKIEVPTIEYQMLDSKIGYIVISEFDEVTVNQFIAAVNKLEKDGMTGLIVDVRDNPGGLLASVVKILDRLLPPELIVYTEDKNGNRDEQKAVDNKKISVPMAVLINGQSASASEIFAGTLQDYKVATIVGTTSFGKGIVQKVIPLSDGTAVKLTISKYYTPNGRNIHGKGITPDVEVELKDELKNEVVIPIDKDNQLQEAIKLIKNKIKK
jgi:carboxyl-terminal processing protease